MCGIAGFFAAATLADDIPVPALLSALRHRGPDGEGVHRDERVLLVHTRLSVVDLTPGGAQPMSSPDGEVIIVFNGEIYNFRDERRRLEERGHRFTSQSDTEVILRAYLADGERCVARLRGMFAFAIYDRREGRGREKLLLARDPFGIKPLIVVTTARGTAFASEIKALVAGGFIEPELDPVALRDALAWGSVYQPRTILAGARMLEPGTFAVYQKRSMRQQRFWEFSDRRYPELARADDVEAAQAVADVLRDSVERQLVADVPICSFLSGGIDSALTTAFMVEQHGARVCTYSVGFESVTTPIDESADALLVARHLGTEHHAVIVGDTDIVQLTEHIGSSLDQPSIDGTNAYFVSRAVAESYKVAVSGTGGDELFAGYPWFAASYRRTVPRWGPLAPLARRLLPRRRDSRLMQMLAFADLPGHFVAQHQALGLQAAIDVMHPRLRHPALATFDSFLDLGQRDRLAKAAPLSRLSLLCLDGYTQNQLLRDIDAMSMRNGIEVRVPLLDPIVADVAMALPERFKLAQSQPGAAAGSYAAAGIKKVLLDIGQPLLPADFATRPKRGFNMPYDDWLRGPLRELLHDTLAPARVAADGVLEPSVVSAYLREFSARRSPASSVWMLLIVSLWASQMLRVWTR